MQTLPLGSSPLLSSRIVHGCMRLAGDGSANARRKGLAALEAAVAAGINHFDHADIYGGGSCERGFREFLAADSRLRERLILTSKCGIRGANDPFPGAPARYDFSAGHLLKSVDGILDRLGIAQLDILLLHRPDSLMNPEAVAGAFDQLHRSGKVAHFGVSNFSTSQVRLLQAFSDYPLIINQVEFNIHRIAPLEDGVLDQCLELGMAPQSWCPLGGVAYPAWGNTFTPEQQHCIQEELRRQAAVYGCDPSAVILAWILLHPARIFPVIGTMTAARVQACVQAIDLPYTREDWYRLLEARKGAVA